MEVVLAIGLLPGVQMRWPIIGLAALMVFLILAAQYEKWSLPLAVILIVPLCLFGGIFAVWLTGHENNIFTQIGFIVLIGLAASGLTLATSWGGTEYPWTSPMILGLFVGSVVALGIFIRVELRAAEPILPLRLFGDPVFTVCCVLAFIVGFAMLGAMTFLPTYMQFVDGVSATVSGLRTLPMVVGMLITSIGSGAVVGRTGRYKIFPIAGTAIMTLAFVLLSRMDPDTSTLRQSLYLFVLGTGIGLCMQVLVLIVQNTVSFSDLGVATSGVTFFRTIGSSFGAAIFGSLFSNFLADRLGPALVIDIDHHNGGPFLGKQPRRLTANPAACAGNQSNFLWSNGGHV